jgi:hypothetical protein
MEGINFFIHRLASTKAYQKKKKTWGLSFKKINDDVIIRSQHKESTEEYAFFKNKVDLFQDFSQKLICTYFKTLRTHCILQIDLLMTWYRGVLDFYFSTGAHNLI